jgi:DMSO reductase anchor subunit
MHPAFSVIFLTTLIGAGQGLFLALYTEQVYSTFNVVTYDVDGQFHGLGSFIALALTLGGLLASFFHLGRPARAWRSWMMWRTSWLSREVIMLPAFMLFLFVYGVAHYFGWSPVLFTVGTVPVTFTLFIGLITTGLAFLLYICTGMIYATLKFLQEWHSPLTVINYTLLGMASGFSLSAAFSGFYAAELVVFFAGWAIILTLAGLLTRIASLMRNSKLKPKSDVQSAIGMRHPNVVQKDQGFQAGSFNTREFFHHAKPAVFRGIKWFFLVTAFALPVLMLAAGMGSGSAELIAVAFVIQYVGLLAERWFFFAQANHPQNIYYQLVS